MLSAKQSNPKQGSDMQLLQQDIHWRYVGTSLVPVLRTQVRVSSLARLRTVADCLYNISSSLCRTPPCRGTFGVTTG